MRTDIFNSKISKITMINKLKIHFQLKYLNNNKNRDIAHHVSLNNRLAEKNSLDQGKDMNLSACSHWCDFPRLKFRTLKFKKIIKSHEK